MLKQIRDRVIPPEQRRTLDDLGEDLLLRGEGLGAKRSAFWTMLTLAGVIATAGVLADSTATVIGAMIIAPLSQPIMGVALGIVQRRRTGSLWFVVLGATWVVLIGVGFSFLLPGTFDPTSNGQITGRTSPTVLDLTAAIATGFAGAIAMSRRDVAAVLPGVAIAISLVPPLGVVGVCLGLGYTAYAFGATVLFLSNIVALVLAGSFVFAVLAYTGDDALRRSRRATATLTVSLVLVAVPLLGNTLFTIVLAGWSEDAKEAAEEWVAGLPQAEVTEVEFVHARMHVRVRGPANLPSAEDLLARISERVPAGVGVVLDHTVGKRIDIGTTD